jgi:hypothetical protein
MKHATRVAITLSLTGTGAMLQGVANLVSLHLVPVTPISQQA